jgi:hypothetical protein
VRDYLEIPTVPFFALLNSQKPLGIIATDQCPIEYVHKLTMLNFISTYFGKKTSLEFSKIH